jgi:hypothetical protein
LEPAERIELRWADVDRKQAVKHGLGGGLVGGLGGGLFELFTFEANPGERKNPNQGMRRSLRAALLFGLGVGLVWGLGGGLVFGLVWGLGVGLVGGGMFCLQHLILRLVLWLSRSAPLNYVAFLEQVKDLLFLRQVGGYIFTHRLLREYFASLPQAEKEADPRAEAAPAA